VTYYPIEILPTIYRYGYAMPFYNVQRATRTVLFSTRNQGECSILLILLLLVSFIVSLPTFLYHSQALSMNEANVLLVHQWA
jgi:hypothetical protein